MSNVNNLWAVALIIENLIFIAVVVAIVIISGITNRDKAQKELLYEQSSYTIPIQQWASSDIMKALSEVMDDQDPMRIPIISILRETIQRIDALPPVIEIPGARVKAFNDLDWSEPFTVYGVGDQYFNGNGHLIDLEKNALETPTKDIDHSQAGFFKYIDQATGKTQFGRTRLFDEESMLSKGQELYDESKSVRLFDALEDSMNAPTGCFDCAEIWQYRENADKHRADNI